MNLPGVPQATIDSQFARMANITAHSAVGTNSSLGGNSSAADATSILSASTGPSQSPSSYPTGWFTGFVANSSDPSDVLSGVAVQAFVESGGSPCSPTICSSVTTGANGSFTVVCAVGRDYVGANLGYFAGNKTFATCTLNTSIAVGTIYLVPDGIVIGTVLGDVSGDPALPGIAVLGASRDYSTTATPQVSTNRTGGFRVPVPPNVAGIVSFQVQNSASWQNNLTWVSVPPGVTINIGTVFLEPNNAQVTAKLEDVVTHQPIRSGYGAPNAITVCSQVTQVCGTQGLANQSGNDQVTAVGPPGPDYVIAYATGYLVNQSYVGNMPATQSGHSECVPNNCIIYLTPMAQIEFSPRVAGTNISYGFGLWYITVTSSNAYIVAQPRLNPATYQYNMTSAGTFTEGCLPVGGTVVGTIFPLRNTVDIQPDTTATCGMAPTWPIPGDAPVWGNETWVNGTPDEVTPVGYLNLTLGDYVQGQVLVAGTTDVAPTGGFTVTISSRVAPSTTLAPYPYFSTRSPNVCPRSGATYFCAPAPPGADLVTVSAANTPNNVTWLDVPVHCCLHIAQPLHLAQVTTPFAPVINMTEFPSVNGTVVQYGSSAPVAYPGVQICPASSHPIYPGCINLAGNRTGGYSGIGVPLGWDVVIAVGSGYAPNSAWIDVTGNETLAPIPLTALATLVGRVVDSTGAPVIDATIDVCPLAANNAGECTSPLGPGTTTSDGNYEGEVTGGWLPAQTYLVQASAPGYVTDWTWVNATSNSISEVPTIVLPTVGAVGAGSAVPGRTLGSGPSGATAPATPGSTSVWITGRVIDASTGRGIITQQISACPVPLGLQTCIGFSSASNSGGFFNDSLPTGIYNLTVSGSGYVANTTLLTALVGPSVSAGTIELEPLAWIYGRVLLDPWYQVWVNTGNVSSPVFHVIWLGPPSTVYVCTESISCGTSVHADSSGAFAAPTYQGRYLVMLTAPTANGGMVQNETWVNTTGLATNLNMSTDPQLDLWVTVFGAAKDANSWNATTLRYDLPASWASVTAESLGGNVGTAKVTANGSGEYVAWVPGGDFGNECRVTITNQAFYYPETYLVASWLGPGHNMSFEVPHLNLTRYGYLQAQLVNNATGAPAIDAPMSAQIDLLLNTYTTSGAANGGGQINITAPSGSDILVTVGGSYDYNSTTLQVAVLPDNATVLTSDNVSANGAVGLPPWGWVLSTEVNYTVPLTYAGTVFDPVHNAPVPQALVVVATTSLAVGQGGSQPTNELGEFFSDAPIGRADIMTVSASGYVTNTTPRIGVAPGAFVPFATVNLTGDGVIASQVLSDPSGLPVPGAIVTVCTGVSSTGVCVPNLVQTNATGFYWFAAPPGALTISVSANGYSSNYTELGSAVSETWKWLPAFHLIANGDVFGTVRGLPTGLPVAQATVAACSPLGGTPTGPCSFSVNTLSDGTFSLSLPAGEYILAVSAPRFNSTFLPVAVTTGGAVNLGLVFLQQDGVVLSGVVDAVTNAPLTGATIYGCSVDAEVACGAPVISTSDGSFRLTATPGPVLVSAVMNGYENAYTEVDVPSGATIIIPDLHMVPIGAEVSYAVSGQVLGPGGHPVAGAAVEFTSGSAVVRSVSTDAAGAFSAVVTSGSYLLVANAPGFTTVRLPLNVHAEIRGLAISLGLFNWTVSGVLTDGLTGAALPGATVTIDGELVGTTGALGEFSVDLPNGTYALGLTAPGSYAPLSFTISVDGAPIAWPATAVPRIGTLSGTVRSSSSSSVLSGASVSITGTAVDGAAVSYVATTDSGGAYSVPVYFGNYTVTFSADGFTGASQSAVVVASSSASADATLSPITTSSSASTAPWLILGAGVALIVGALAAIGFLGRKKVASR
ncbi:MAG: carboxypeptidase regulatory-like domain-containing protein [Thermoplasmata archaeon]